MPSKQQFQNLPSRTISRAAIAALTMAIVFVLTLALIQPAQAQTFKVIHTFTGGQDGTNPFAGLTLDKAGNLYGTAVEGGNGYGTVYQLKHKDSGWVYNPLYSFAWGSDGANPQARLIFGPNGNLYGTTEQGGQGYGQGECWYGCGTVFKLRPSPRACTAGSCPWTEDVLFRFPGGSDGELPIQDGILFDQAGNLYGTTFAGGAGGDGIVYELTPSGSGWTETVLHSFDGQDGRHPLASLIFDSAGNLYGTTSEGGDYGAGTVYVLKPSGSGWIETVLYSFQGNDGAIPAAGLTLDSSGNLYGACSAGGTGGGGTIFELMPSNGSWTLKTLYSFASTGCFRPPGPSAALVMDGAGDLYGTTVCGGANNAGSVFKLTPSSGRWTETSLYDFTGGSDGGNPISEVVFDANGNLYGTASAGGVQNYNYGVVWEITP